MTADAHGIATLRNVAPQLLAIRRAAEALFATIGRWEVPASRPRMRPVDERRMADECSAAYDALRAALRGDP